jgi:hypothetical protein
MYSNQPQMMSFIKLCLFSICLLTASLAVGQTDSTKASRRAEKEDRPPSAFWERTRFGGNFALQLGFNTFIDVSPTLTHIVSDKLQVGGGVTFMYVRFTAFNPFTGAQVRQPGNAIFGGRVFTRFFPVSALPRFFYRANWNRSMYSTHGTMPPPAILIGCGALCRVHLSEVAIFRV